MAKVIAPNKDYTGESASVAFVRGVGECDKPELLDWFREHGYAVEEGDKPKIKGRAKADKAAAKTAESTQEPEDNEPEDKEGD